MIQKETGWTDDYLLWGLSWVNVQMKLADAPYYKYKSGKPGKGDVIDEEDLADFLNNLNN